MCEFVNTRPTRKVTVVLSPSRSGGPSSDNHLAELDVSALAVAVPLCVAFRVEVEQAGDRLFRGDGAQGAAAGAATRAAAEGPVVALAGAAVVDYAETKVLTVFFVGNGVAVADLDVVVLPAGELVGLSLGQPSGAGRVEKGGGNETTTDQIDGVVMAQVHGGPPDPAGVDDEKVAELGEGVAHEESLQDGIGGVQRGERAKRQRRVGKVGGVEVDAKDGVDAGETSRRAVHAIGRRNQTVFILIPGRRAGKHELNSDAENAHPAKAARKDVDGTRSGKDEEDEGANGGGAKVHDAVGQPGENVEDGVLVGGQNVGQVGAVQDVFEGGKHANPNVRTVLGGNESEMC